MTQEETPEEKELEALSEILGFCGCSPCEYALEFVRDVLWEVEKLDPTPRPRIQPVAMCISKSLAIPTGKIAKALGVPEGAVGVVVNLLDQHDLHEHGSNMCNGWLTKKGEEFCQRLFKVLPKS
jgi:hypothetical protein